MIGAAGAEKVSKARVRCSWTKFRTDFSADVKWNFSQSERKGN